MIAVLRLPPEEIARLRERAGGHTLAPLVAAGLAAALGAPFPAHVWELYDVRYLPTREAFRAREGRGLDLGDRRAVEKLCVTVPSGLAGSLRRYATKERRSLSSVVTSALIAAGLVVTGSYEGERPKRGPRPLDGVGREKVTVYLSGAACARVRAAVASQRRHATVSQAVRLLLDSYEWRGAPAEFDREARKEDRLSLSLTASQALALREFAKEHRRPLASGILTALALAEAAQKGGA